MLRQRSFLLGLCLSSLSIGELADAQTPLTAELFANGFNRPVWIGSPPGEKERMFVVEQNTALVRIIKNGAILPTPFINLLSKVNVSGNERGLLGFAFHPNYAANGFFYVNYTKSGASSGATMVERYQVSATNPDVANPSSATTMIGPISQPASNHNGGNIVFGPDGYLYIGMGDGGGAGDTPCNAQNPGTLLGKMLRIDVDNGGAAPPTNPFVGNPAFLNEIWAYGLRNPWRFSFDSANGDLYIGDVGQNAVEEIDWVPGTSTGGENYAWKVMEGNNCFSVAGCGAFSVPACNDASFTDPIRTFNHSAGHCSVTGGHVYRGCAIPDLAGTYFYADFCSNRIWSFQLNAGHVINFMDRTAELDPPGAQSITSISSFGVDECGEIYICDLNGGEIFKIVPNVPAPGADLGNGKVGGNGLVPTLDVCGLLNGGNSADVSLTDAPATTLTLLFASLNQNPVNTLGGTIIPDLNGVAQFSIFTGAGGSWVLTVPGGFGTFSVYVQAIIDDPAASFGVGISNAWRLDFLP